MALTLTVTSADAAASVLRSNGIPHSRDPNGNLTLVNGQFEGASYSSQSGSQMASSHSGGVGTSGAGAQYGQASAIGNQLNVVVLGSHNTTVVDTTQINNGNQTANVDLNSH